MRRIRPSMPRHTVYGSLKMYSDPGAMIGDIGHPGCIGEYWDLASGIVFLSDGRMLLTTEVDETRWQTRIDQLLKQIPEEGITRLRWKASRHGGRPFVSGAVTSNQVAATRRARKSRNQPEALQSITEVEVVGIRQAGEHEVIQRLMEHLATLSSIPLKEPQGMQDIKSGSWKWMGHLDPTAAAGRSRRFLQSAEEVQKVKSAPDGHTIKIGSDSFLVRVHNDLDVARGRSRASA